MSFIQDIYQQHIVQSAPETKGTFFSVINYIVYGDESGIKKKDLEDRFALRKSYVDILNHLKDNNVIAEEESNILVDSEAKEYLKTVLQNVLAKCYESKYGQFSTNEVANSSEVSILLSCRSELYNAH